MATAIGSAPVGDRRAGGVGGRVDRRDAVALRVGDVHRPCPACRLGTATGDGSTPTPEAATSSAPPSRRALVRAIDMPTSLFPTHSSSAPMMPPGPEGGGGWSAAGGARPSASEMARVTLQTIADRLGVSRMTVSNAFSPPGSALHRAARAHPRRGAGARLRRARPGGPSPRPGHHGRRRRAAHRLAARTPSPMRWPRGSSPPSPTSWPRPDWR